ncbi:unnamed protein product [Hermetia illucens]|uniref:Uncharacterized protein n=1 Tax=Hermetia illucens TaxID=343691 RepID=A0A7R8UIQ9_HERIL|nr:unnamed protein product [Hermetia illucens]
MQGNPSKGKSYFNQCLANSKPITAQKFAQIDGYQLHIATAKTLVDESKTIITEDYLLVMNGATVEKKAEWAIYYNQKISTSLFAQNLEIQTTNFCVIAQVKDQKTKKMFAITDSLNPCEMFLLSYLEELNY